MRYRHWKNWAQGGETAFVTTTCLDFAHLFAREEMRDRMVRLLCLDAVHYQAPLHAFVVMTHHMHVLVTAPEGKSVSSLMRLIKMNSAKELLPLLAGPERQQLEMQVGLDGRQFWQRSFRSVVVDSDAMFRQKVDYIHENPVRAEFVERPEDYRWSSAWLYERGVYDEHFGLAHAALDGTMRSAHASRFQ